MLNVNGLGARLAQCWFCSFMRLTGTVGQREAVYSLAACAIGCGEGVRRIKEPDIFQCTVESARRKMSGWSFYWLEGW